MGTLSGYYIIVQKMLSHMTANIVQEFARKSSDEDRVAYILSLDFVEKAFSEIQPVRSEGKSVNDSKKLRDQGNSFYQKGDYKNALEYYTKALLAAPTPVMQQDEVSEEMVLAQGNRSATLFQMHRYEECLHDIEIALRYGYPAHLRYKLYDRQGRCFLEQDDIEHALKAFENVVDALEKSQLNEQQQNNAKRNTIKQIETCKLMLQANGSTIKKPPKAKTNLSPEPPPMPCENSLRYPQASAAFDVKFSLEKGRYGVAALDIKVGDVVIAEDPFVSVLDPSQYALRCYHCFKMLSIPLGCYKCTRIRYCSEQCRVEAWEGYHRYECSFLNTIISSGTGNMTHLVMKSMMITGLSKIIKYKNNPKSDQQDAQHSLFTDSKGVYMGGFVGVYGLLTHTIHRSPNDLLQYTFLAIFILTLLKRCGFMDPSREQEISKSNGKNGIQACIGGIILRFLQIVTCNGIEVTEMLIGENLQKSHPTSIGLAFYPTVCLINHSCDPVMELVFYDTKCVARALRNLPNGTELTIDYGYLYYVTPKQQRQLSLKAQYFFDCCCNACTGNWNLRAHLRCDIPILKCTNCGIPLPLFDMKTVSSKQGQQKGKVKCQKCDQEENVLEVLENLQKSSRQEEKALDEARRFMLLKAAPVLEAHLTLLDKHVCLPWKDYVTCTSMLKQCYRMMGNRARRIEAL